MCKRDECALPKHISKTQWKAESNFCETIFSAYRKKTFYLVLYRVIPWNTNWLTNCILISADYMFFYRTFLSYDDFTSQHLAPWLPSSSATSTKFLGPKYFDIKRATVFGLGNRVWKHKTRRYARHLGGHGPYGPTDYASYVSKKNVETWHLHVSTCPCPHIQSIKYSLILVMPRKCAFAWFVGNFQHFLSYNFSERNKPSA